MIDAWSAPVPPSNARRLRRAAARIYAALGPLEDLCRDGLRAFAFQVRRVLIRLGLAKKTLLVMTCADNREIDGFYAQFVVVLGLLAHCERWKDAIAGARVDFEDKGLYYDAALGKNSWNYFFQAVDTSRESGAAERRLDVREQYRFFEEGEALSRGRAAGLIARYVQVRPAIRARIDAFAAAQFAGFHVIGVHYRGTDKWTEAPRVPYEEVCAAVRIALGESGAGPQRLFVASDEQAFVECMLRSFPGKVVFWETRRSTDGQPIDRGMENNYRKGEDAVIDCVLLSRCHRLIRTRSNLGLCSTFFNPALPAVVLNERS